MLCVDKASSKLSISSNHTLKTYWYIPVTTSGVNVGGNCIYESFRVKPDVFGSECCCRRAARACVVRAIFEDCLIARFVSVLLSHRRVLSNKERIYLVHRMRHEGGGFEEEDIRTHNDKLIGMADQQKKMARGGVVYDRHCMGQYGRLRAGVCGRSRALYELELSIIPEGEKPKHENTRRGPHHTKARPHEINVSFGIISLWMGPKHKSTQRKVATSEISTCTLHMQVGYNVRMYVCVC